MYKPWIDPKIIIGNKASGEYYYPRKDIENEILNEIKKGNHILIAAPRRFGKTSIIAHLAEKCTNGMKCIFDIVQGIPSERDFYKRLYELILSCLRWDKKLLESLGDKIKTIGVEEISPKEGKIKFSQKKQLDYLAEIDKILTKLTQKNIQLALFIDELPEVLHNLYKKGRTEEAKAILKNLRRWRQDDQFKSLRLILTGSIGIHHVVKAIEGRTSDINDPNEIKFEPFTVKQAKDYVDHVTQGASVRYDKDLQTYLLSKTQYFIPYFINLLLDEVNRIARSENNKIITKKTIDIAFTTVIKDKDYFKDWKNRLFEYFDANEALFMNEVLLFIAHNDKINLRKLYDLAVKHERTIDYMDYIDSLEKDGYITQKEGNFVFVSPFLKAFWKRNQPIYDEK